MEWRVTKFYEVDFSKEAPNVLPFKLRKLDPALDVASEPAGGTARNISITVEGNSQAEAESNADKALKAVGVEGELPTVDVVIEGTTEEEPVPLATRPQAELPQGDLDILEAEEVPLNEGDDPQS